ncbi:uncharacterized protein K452DRAFT_65413 [Aplosporella prunicola CBS 121167]|uniref:Uncharacterized protein n=1 Tax=Aplosporella prunicola CBS 121167 TaxID=1176127 RepID=A0A6A6AVA3_9PEZI|nr:uncharacterized protein K452DRAFT_65413 [Aplosporella prunicola CBS 121167]KAF2135138.1 hypothetical protein K452DRAFT_65413 [Aplosporella prunicola CBS 121167]
MSDRQPSRQEENACERATRAGRAERGRDVMSCARLAIEGRLMRAAGYASKHAKEAFRLCGRRRDSCASWWFFGGCQGGGGGAGSFPSGLPRRSGRYRRFHCHATLRRGQMRICERPDGTVVL